MIPLMATTLPDTTCATPDRPLRMSVAVYCGSRPGQHPAYMALAQSLGTAIGRRGWQLVYGGGRAGLMGAVADATLAAGGRVVGVIPKSLMQLEVGHGGLHELHVVDTMHQRKQLMAERSHGFIAMPGGIGTFEELFEVWTWRHLGYHDRPMGLLDTQGYWAPLLGFLRNAVGAGFMDDDQMAMLSLADDADTLLDLMAAQAGDLSDDHFGLI